MRTFLAITLVLMLAVPAAAQLSFLGFKNSMVQFLLDQISTEGEFEIKAEQVEEPEDGVTALRGVSIADQDGVWFTAESFDFNWSPSRLLRGEIEFQRLAMTGVRILRQPVSKVEVKAEEEAPQEGLTFEWPRSPLTLRIERLAAIDVALAEAVLGHAIAFDAEGAAQDEGDVQSVRLDITRRDAVEGRIALDYERRFDTNTLRMNLDAREGPAGLIAALGGLPSDAASTARIAADGPPEDWRMTLAIALAETIDVAGEAAISYEGPLKVDATVRASPGPQLDRDLAALLGTAATVRAKAAEGPDGVILIERGEVTSPDLDLVASGSYARPTGAADLAVELTARPGLAAPIDGVDFDGFGFVGTVKGAPGDMAADGDLSLSRLRTEPVDVAKATLAIDIRQETPAADPAGPAPQTTTRFSVAGETLGLRLDKIGADVLRTPTLDIAGSLTGSELTLERANLESGVLRLAAKGLADLEGPEAAVEVELSAPEFAPVAAAYGIELTGRLDTRTRALLRDGRLDASTTTTLANFSHDLGAAESLTVSGLLSNKGETVLFDVRGNGIGLRIDQVKPELLGVLEFASAGKLEGDRLTLDRSTSRSELMELSASGSYDLAEQAGAFDYQARTAEMEPITALYDLPLAGRTSVTGRIGLTPDAPRIDGAARVDGLVFDGTGYGNLTLDHDVTVGPVPQGTIALSLAGSPWGNIETSTALSFDAPTLSLRNLDLRALGARARGDLTLDTERQLADGALNLEIASLEPLSQLGGTELSGSAAGRLSLNHSKGKQNAEAEMTLRRLISAGVAIEQASLTANLRDVLGRLGLASDLEATGVSAGDIALSSLSASARGRLAAIDLSAELNGQWRDEPLTASLAGQADAEGPVFGVFLTALDAALDEERIGLNEPLAVRAEGSSVKLTGLDLSLPRGGRLSGDLSKRGNALLGTLSLSGLDARLAKRFADAPVLAGTIAADARFDTSRSADVSLAATGMKFENVDVDGALDLTTELSWSGRRAQVGGQLSGGFGDPLQFTGAFPLRPGLVPSVPGRGPVDGQVQWRGQIGDLWALVPAPGHIVTGEMEIDLSVGGDISDPQIGGEVAISEGGYQNLDLGTILTDLTLTTQAEPGGALGFSLSALDGATGTVKTEGSVALDASGLEIQTEIDQAVLVRRDEATARVDGAVTVSGPFNALAVDGDIVLETVEVRLVSSASANIVDLGEVLIKGEPEPEVRESDSNVSLRLDITSPGRIFVRGRGLDSTWGLDMQVRGTAAKPVVTGAVERVRGRLDLIGKGFDLETGRISFDGRTPIDPRLDLVFERETDDLTGRIVISGRGSDPKLSFASSPALPEDEVLPRTLFGKSSQALTGSQAIQLALGLATLMDGGGGTLDQVRGAVGLDQLRVEQDDDGNASLAAGKEVAEGVFVGAKQGLTGGETKVIVEIDVFDDISIDAEVGQQSGSSVGLKWEKDF